MSLSLAHFLSLLIFSVGFVSASDDELRSLLEFKKGIQEDPLGKVLSSWNQSSTGPRTCPRLFFGVNCDDSGHVDAIVLDRLGLVGEMKFSTLNGIKMLKILSLSGNFLSGRLVPELGSMSSLQYLDLSGNRFYGPIPGPLNDLWGLNYLNFSSNNFSGWFPSGIGNLQQLKVLDLHSNGIHGDIQGLLSELRNVEHVDLSCNLFHGSLPMGFQNISTLATTVQYLNLSHNRLVGRFFNDVSMTMFRNLQVLDFGDNQLSGELPSFGSLPSLQVLRLGSNQFQGSIPEALLETSIRLEELDLSCNGFSGSIRGINSTTLHILNLSSNALSGSLPSSLAGGLIMDLSTNMLSGDVSIMESWKASLEVIDLSSNKLSGNIPNLISQSQSLITLNMRNNSLTGAIPPDLGTYLKLSAVDLSSNELDGPIPRSFFASVTLTNLNLSGNHITGMIPLQGSHPSELLVLPSYPPIESLDLSDNFLTGTIPSDIGNLGRLKLLNLANNGLSGKIPNELGNLNGLEYLDLSRNNFTGEIPNNLPSTLKVFNLSYNDLSGPVPKNVMNFPITSFRPGNTLLNFRNGRPIQSDNPDGVQERQKHHSLKSSIKVAIIVASVVTVLIIAIALLAYYQAHVRDFHVRGGFSDQIAGRDVKFGIFSRPSLLKFHRGVERPPTSSRFSNDHLLTSVSRSLSGPREFGTEAIEHVFPEGVDSCPGSKNLDVPDNYPVISGKNSSACSLVSSSSRFIEAIEQSATVDVNSPDRLAGELFFLDDSLALTAEELSRAPAEVLGRGSHGTLYKATLNNGHLLTVKWLRVGLVQHKKDFAKEGKKIGLMRHPNIASLRAYYWGPREQERLILADFVQGENLALHLYETTPQRGSVLSFSQRLKIAVDVAKGLIYLHDRSLAHGNLKPTNILLAGSDLHACLTDYGLYRLMTPSGLAEQILNLGALGYRAPELANAAKPYPSFKADVYAFGVILMELLTRRSAGEIISGQSGAVDLTDWVLLCDQEGRRLDCIDKDIRGRKEPSKAMDELLTLSLRCILPVNDRPNLRQVFEDLCSISA